MSRRIASRRSRSSRPRSAPRPSPRRGGPDARRCRPGGGGATPHSRVHRARARASTRLLGGARHVCSAPCPAAGTPAWPARAAPAWEHGAGWAGKGRASDSRARASGAGRAAGRAGVGRRPAGSAGRRGPRRRVVTGGIGGGQATGTARRGGGSAASPSAAKSRRPAWGAVTAPGIRRGPPQRSQTSTGIANTRWRSRAQGQRRGAGAPAAARVASSGARGRAWGSPPGEGGQGDGRATPSRRAPPRSAATSSEPRSVSRRRASGIRGSVAPSARTAAS